MYPTRNPLIVFVLVEIECTLIKLRRSILVYVQVEIRRRVSMTLVASCFLRPPLCVRRMKLCAQMPKRLIAEITSLFFSL